VTLIGHLVGIACDAIAMHHLERALAAARGDAAGLAQLRKVLEEPVAAPDLAKALRGEMYMGIALIRNLKKMQLRQAIEGEDVQLDARDLRRDGLPEGLVDRAYLARHLQAWTEAHDLMSRHPGDFRAQARVVEQISTRYDSRRRLSLGLNAVLFPVFAQAGEAYVRREAKERVTLALAKAMEFKSKHGRFPQSLDELGPLPPDPFDGQALRYLETDDGIRIYSVGENGRDDGGLDASELPRGVNRRESDVVASYPPIITARAP
jgi:hypothetical protein